MITAEQAAVEYAESLEDNDYTIETEAAFKSGAEFAQQFIPYSEEEPPQEETVLVKLNNGHVFTAKYVKSAKCKENDVWHDGCSFYNVKNTHWRPIFVK